jgi:RND family efflux transporter MFP subunit
MNKNPLFIAGLLIVGWFTSCGNNSSNPEKAKIQTELDSIRAEIGKLQTREAELMAALGESADAKNKLVEIMDVQPSKFISEITVEGIVDASGSTIATAKAPGTVTSILVKEGQRVQKGQILATLDRTALESSKRELEQQLSFANTIYEKQLRLWEKGIGTEVQYLTAKNQRDGLERSLNTLNSNIDMYNIKSAINGTIESIDLKIGQVASPGMPYFKLLNLNNIKVKAEVSEAYSGKINSGDSVEILFPDLNQSVSGVVNFASKFIDPLNRTFKVEVSLPQVNSVKPNMIAKLRIVDYVKNEALVIPANSIQRTELGTFVMLYNNENKAAKKVNIEVGKTNMNTTEIIGGLNTGDQLIINGFQELADGQKVSIAK